MTLTKNVNGKDIPLTGEEIAEFQAMETEAEAQKGRRYALNQILALEATITARRRDEAILGIDNGWLLDIRNQISELRKQL